MTRSSLSAPFSRCFSDSSTRRLVTTALFVLLASQVCNAAYYGKLIGKLTELHHGVSGEVYAVDARTLYIKDLTYDGEGPTAWFYVNNAKGPNGNGIRLRDERGSPDVLKKYRKKGVTLTLPEGKTLNNIKWFYIWCDEFAVNFGDVRIPRNFDYPRPQKLNGLNGVHRVSSEPIVVVDAQTLLIPGFSYDGEAPDAKFWVGPGPHPSPQGYRVPDENGRVEPLRLYDRKTIVLTLPGDLTVHQLGHFGVWCEAFTVDFGHVQIPQNLNVPPSLKMLGVSPQNLREGQGQAGFTGLRSSSRESLLDEISGAQLNTKNYDNSNSRASLSAQRYERPTTYRPAILYRRSDDGVQIVKSLEYRVPKSVKAEEVATAAISSPRPNNSRQPVKSTTRTRSTTSLSPTTNVEAETSFETLPPGRATSERSSTTRSYKLDNPEIFRPNNDSRRVVYPGGSTTYHHIREFAPKAEKKQQLKEQEEPEQKQPKRQEPQQASYSRLRSFQGDQRIDSYSKLNCEVLEDNLAFEVRWAVAGDSIVVQLVGKLDAGQYMSFGLSANPERSVMVGGDVVVAWVDKQTLQGYAVDYFLDAKSQCSGGRGSCPDTRIQANTNSVRLLNAAMVNGYSIVTYQRPLKASDELDRQIRTNGSQAIIWAIGPLNERREVSFHSDYLKTDKFIEFGRPPAWNCPMPDTDSQNIHAESSEQNVAVTTRRTNRLPPTPAPAPRSHAWEIPPIECYEPDDGVLYAQLGPTGGKHGYPAITGHVGWGISWYINGLLIPVINVVRGQKYTFIVEGGNEVDVPARYHPFYITDDPVGGYEHKTPEEKAKVKIFAGISRQGGTVRPTGVGRLCNWIHDPEQPDADTYNSFGAFQRSLNLKCDRGEPGFVEWTPDENTPDTVYYQCYTHRYLGWKINVVDKCEDSTAAQASESLAVYADAPKAEKEGTSDLEGSSSIRVTSKVTQPPEFYEQHRNLHHHYNHHNNHQSHYQYHPNNYYHNPPGNSQGEHSLRYHVHKQHANYPHYAITPNNNQAGSLNGKFAMQAANIDDNSAQLTSTTSKSPMTTPVAPRLGGFPYDSRQVVKNYEEQTLPIRSLSYQSMKPPIIHHNHHYSPQLTSFHHHYPHFVTRSQLALESVNNRPPGGVYGPRPHHRNDLRSQSLGNVHFYREIPIDTADKSAFLNNWKQSAATNVTSELTNGFGLSNFDEQKTKLTDDQETRQSSTVPISILPSPSSNQASSNLVTDQRPIMSYGQTKYAYSHPGTSQYVYSRPPQNHPTVITNPHKIGQQQIMIVRRPIVQKISQRRPVISSMLVSGGQDLPPLQSGSSRPLMIERKKSIYQGPQKMPIGKQNGSHNNVNINNNNNNNNNINNNANHVNEYNESAIENQIKLTKDSKQHAEPKISTEEEVLDSNIVQIIKPARNTGFDPDSIVIESGFKPIIRNVERDSNAGRSQVFMNVQSEDYQMEEAENEDNYDQENFEPMFVPSPLDRNNAKKNILKKLRKAQSRRKTRLDDIDDMEMAADRLDSYYLPPSGSSSFSSSKGIENGRTRAPLVTYDGKLIEDKNLAQSVPQVENKRSRSHLSSEILSKTPQFGKFKGELPPPIPGEKRIDDSANYENQEYEATGRDRFLSNSGITKLTALKRNKRSGNDDLRDLSNVHLVNDTDRLVNHSAHDHFPHDRSFHDHSVPDHSSHDHSVHDHSSHDHSSHMDHPDSQQLHTDHHEDQEYSSTGEMLIANFQYIVLTIILYYAI